jgi:hypothetical protein
VLSAFSDYTIRFGEKFRFEELVDALCVGDAGSGGISGSEGEGGDADGVGGAWEARAAVMTLVNAITNCPEELEERVRLREELGRRGLNEVIVVCISKFLVTLGRIADVLPTFLPSDTTLHSPFRSTSYADRRLHGGEIRRRGRIAGADKDSLYSPWFWGDCICYLGRAGRRAY